MEEIERRLLPYAQSSNQGRGKAIRVLVRAPRSFGDGRSFNTGIVRAADLGVKLDVVGRTLNRYNRVRVITSWRRRVSRSRSGSSTSLCSSAAGGLLAGRHT